MGSQPFGQEIAFVPNWKVIELTEHVVAQFLIKLERLKVECVYHGMMAASLFSFSLGKKHQVAPEALKAKVPGNPESFDLQPTPHRGANQATNGFNLSVSEYNNQWYMDPGLDTVAKSMGAEPLFNCRNIPLSGRAVDRCHQVFGNFTSVGVHF